MIRPGRLLIVNSSTTRLLAPEMINAHQTFACGDSDHFLSLAQNGTIAVASPNERLKGRNFGRGEANSVR
jgi:hypothetical protein